MRTMLAVLLLLPGAASAGSAFDGTWKVRPDSARTTGKADEFQVLDGMYTCFSCVPEIKVKADGTDQKVEGHPYYDTISVAVAGPSAIRIVEKKHGKRIFAVNYEVSTDGKTLTGKLEDYTGTQVATATVTETRRTAAPEGAHPVSGSWQPEQFSNANEAARVYVYQMTEDHFSMHWNGQSYNAMFDGKQYPVQGDPAKTMVAVKKVNDRTVDETDSREGKVTDEIRLAAASDGTTIQVTDNDVLHQQITTYTLEKQQTHE
jgi:hypothetical protein